MAIDRINQDKTTTGEHGGWHGAEITTEGTPMIDSGTGRPLILRTFEFSINPTILAQLKAKNIRPTKQDLFNYHWGQIRTLIWSDGLTANTDVPPRVVIGKTRYRIFILCEPKISKYGIVNTLTQRTTTLQEVFKKKLTK